MIRIVCTGDSHTWGQGADGVVASFDPPVCAGDLRPVPFRFPCYVNQLRALIEAQTPSFSKEWQDETLSKALACPLQHGLVTVSQPTASLDFEGELLRLVVKPIQKEATLTVRVDATEHRFSVFGANTENDYRLFHIFCPAGKHTLQLTVDSSFALQRMEAYGGEYCVLNGGVGSMPTFAYEAQWFDSHVAAAKPDMILAEAHTINDWLHGATPQRYGQTLQRLLERFLTLTDRVAVLSVIPIGGESRSPNSGEEYNDLARVVPQVAQALPVPFCDARAAVLQRSATLSKAEYEAAWLDDVWHPNDQGHQCYARELFSLLQQQNWINIHGGNTDENR